MSSRWLIRNVYLLKSLLSARSGLLILDREEALKSKAKQNNKK